MREPVIETLGAVWHSISELCDDFDEQQWSAPTECPGWSVQDQVSHLVGSESIFMGQPMPEHSLAAPAPHARNPMGERNEVIVDYRRSRSGREVLEEFRAVTSERLAQLRAMSPDDLAAETMTPVGPGTLRDLLAIRAFDAWVHEQDIRRAVGRPGELGGVGAAHSVQRCFLAMPFVVGKKAGAPDGSSVVSDVTGASPATLAVLVADGRATVLDRSPADPTVRLTMDVEAFTRLGCGRWEPQDAIDSGAVRIEGDRALGERILQQINFMI
jgi:uncharacterized protein (TIGR03083 family)